MDPEDVAGRFRMPFFPDQPGRWLWRTSDGRETVYWVRWEDYPNGRFLSTYWADGHPLDTVFSGDFAEALARLTFADGTPMGHWVCRMGDLPP